MKIFKNINITTPPGIVITESSQLLDSSSINSATEATDNLMISGDCKVFVSKFFGDNSEIQDTTKVDEITSIINGADVVFYQCVFSNNGKGILIGSGDSPDKDFKSLRVSFIECIFENNSRRSPFAQFGQVHLYRCWIKNWGIPETFHEKSYGFRVGSWGQGFAYQCVFTQRPFFQCLNKNFFKDWFAQQLPNFIPGFILAAYSDFGGQIRLRECFKNRWWLRFQGHRGKKMSKKFANSLIEYLTELKINTK